MKPADLADIDVFAAVARERSFRGAARQRGVSAATLSDAVRRLEERLGVRLLNRTTRSVTATEAGMRLLERLGPALAEIDAAIDMLGDYRGTVAGTLRLNVPTVAADLILVDIVPPFLAAYPDIRVELTADDDFTDVLAAGFDAGIRFDESLAQDMIAVPIGPRVQRFVTVAAPAYLARYGTPGHPAEITAHRCIVHRFASGVVPPWEFARAGEQIRITPRGPLVSNELAVKLAAAEAGLGLFHSFEGFVAPRLQAGTLVRILTDWEEAFSGPFLYFASRRLMPGPLRAFVDFVKTRPSADRDAACAGQPKPVSAPVPGAGIAQG
ncbi:LysR family transcriptional regulator [Sphingomonas sp.]|uniref:LysR family transcriptional regulator n=1 Tax=Sphingomonas sp. TaxID=28214 RepID=UPI001DB00489|nr:LysR family transcriptional regulator [Sphingomonas sp.]MBX9796556.1 LysR family transcriptional regulator [Sphingomonas sp.]